MLTKFYNWLLLSSADPKTASLTVRGALTAVIPWVLNASSLACGLHVCSNLDQNSLTQVAGVASDVVFWGLSIVSGCQIVYGFFRKIFRTLTGTHLGVQ